MKKFIVGGVVLLLVIWGVNTLQSSENRNSVVDGLQVSASIPPIGMIAEEIVGELGQVHIVLPPGISPHIYEPTPKDIRTLSESSVFFAVGQELDTWVADMSETAGNVSVVTVDADIDLLAYAEAHHDEHGHDEDEHHEDEHRHEGDDHDDVHEDEEHGDDHDEEKHDDHAHGEFDPHYWLSPDNARIIAATVRDTLSTEDAENADMYSANYDAFVTALDAAEAEWQTSIDAIADSRIVTFHDAWAYFAAYTDIEIAATVEPFPGQQPTPQYLANLEDTVADTGVEAIFTEPQLASDAIEAFITDTGVAYAILDPLGGVDGRSMYIDLISYNINTLVDTLQ